MAATSSVRDLLILNADGPHNGEMAEIVERVNQVAPTWNLLGFVSSQPVRPGDTRDGYPIYGESAIDEHPQASVVAFGWSGRTNIPGERYATLIDPSAFVSRTAKIGAGCVIYPHCFIGLNASVGDHVFSLSGTIINHDDRIEDRVVLCSGVTLAGHVHVEAESYLGQGCQVRQHLRIGRRSLIGMGAVVVEDVPEASVMVGNPARFLRKND